MLMRVRMRLTLRVMWLLVCWESVLAATGSVIVNEKDMIWRLPRDRPWRRFGL